MLSIGEFSKICSVSAKTLRYYAETGLLEPEKIDPENGYRYYSVDQLETMLFINRLKSYSFSLDEIKNIIRSEEMNGDELYQAFARKKNEIEEQINDRNRILAQLENDISMIREGRSVMSYLDDIDIQLADVPKMYLMSVRKMVGPDDYPLEYSRCYEHIFKRIATDKLTMSGPPMVLFHNSEYTPEGLDTEFAVPVKEYATGTRDFCPGLCLKTVLHGPYSGLPSVYAKQTEWAEKNGYSCTGALFEVYVTDPSQVTDESEYITEVYYPVKKNA